jgi:L-ascorbate metabolism protein UlaG (beta-lactamase superfamily)
MPESRAPDHSRPAPPSRSTAAPRRLPGNPARPALAIAAKTKSLLRRYPRILAESIRAHTSDRQQARIARTAAGAAPSQPAQPLSPLEALLSFPSHELAAVWLGHATVLMRVGGLTILTDPVLSQRIGMSLGPMTLGPQRLRPLPAAETSLPPIDAVIISHAHFDHLDKPTLRRLVKPDTCVITARKTARLIPRGFGDVYELDWDHELDVKGVRFSALQPTHWGARAALDRRRGYNSYVIEEPGRGPDHRVLFAGDTALTEAFNHLQHVKLAILGIGAYQPWEEAHATPEQAWQMFRSINAESLLPIHHSTFPLGEEHPDEPMQRLLAAAGCDAHRIVAREAGTLWTPGTPK